MKLHPTRSRWRTLALGLGLAAAAVPASRAASNIPTTYFAYPVASASLWPIGEDAAVSGDWAAITVPDQRSAETPTHVVLVRRLADGRKQQRPVGEPGWGSHRAMAVNAAGQVVGSVQTADSGEVPFVTGPNGRNPVLLDGLGARHGLALAINGAGVVAGKFLGADGLWHAFATNPNQQRPDDLGPGSVATGLSDAGHVVGHAWFTDSDITHAFVRPPGSDTLVNLGALAPYGSQAKAVNNRGVVVGNTCTSTSCLTTAAFTTDANGQNMREVPPIPNHFFGANATGVNSVGQVVGQMYTQVPGGFESHAYVTEASGVGTVDLTGRVTLPQDWYPAYATGINDAGNILVRALHRSPEPDGLLRERPFLLCPKADCQP